MRSKPDEDIQPDEDEMAMANAVMQVAQKKLISQVNGTWSGVGSGLTTVWGGILLFCDGETYAEIVQVSQRCQWHTVVVHSVGPLWTEGTSGSTVCCKNETLRLDLWSLLVLEGPVGVIRNAFPLKQWSYARLNLFHGSLIGKAFEHNNVFWCTFWQFAFSVRIDWLGDVSWKTPLRLKAHAHTCSVRAGLIAVVPLLWSGNSSRVGRSSNHRVASPLLHRVTVLALFKGSKEELCRKYHPNNHITEVFNGAEEDPSS